MSRRTDTTRWADRLLAALAALILGLAGLWAGLLFVLLGGGRCAFNDSGRPCDPGPWVGRWLVQGGGLAGAGALLVLAFLAVCIATGRPLGRRSVPLAAGVVLAGVALVTIGVLVLRSVPAYPVD